MKLEIVGREHLTDLKPPLIVVANHKNYFDHWLLGYALMGRSNSPFMPLRFFTADRFFTVWWTGWGFFLKIVGAIPNRRGQGLDVSLKESLDILKAGGTLAFYPEGRMHKESDSIGEPRRGIGALGLWSNEKILPVAIKGSEKLSDGVKIIFGKPFRVREILSPNPDLKGDERDYVTAANAIMGKVKELFYKN